MIPGGANRTCTHYPNAASLRQALSALSCVIVMILTSSCTHRDMSIHQEFEQLFDHRFQPDEPGGVILVRKNGKTIFLKSYGVADLTTGADITPHTVFNTGSISKTFVAYGILILAQKGLLSLEDSLSLYFDDFDNPEIANKIQIKHLLTHTSGLPDLRKVSEQIEFYLTAKDLENFAPCLQTSKLNFTPGQRFEYSNPAFNGLALIIEKVTQQKWQTFIQHNIFKPAGMEHSKITDGPYPEFGVAHGYVKEDGGFSELDYGEEPTFAAAGNGGVWSTVVDLARYEDAIQQNLFLPSPIMKRSRDIQFFPNWESDKNPQVGQSWFIAGHDLDSNEFGVKIISHTGWQGGFRGFMISIPDKNILYIGLFNRPLSALSESFNPFSATEENGGDLRIEGIRILQNHDWLD